MNEIVDERLNGGVDFRVLDSVVENLHTNKRETRNSIWKKKSEEEENAEQKVEKRVREKKVRKEESNHNKVRKNTNHTQHTYNRLFRRRKTKYD